jgi:hypothetical protein
MGKLKECIKICDLALQADEHNIKSRMRKGFALHRLREPAEAKKDLKIALAQLRKLKEKEGEGEEECCVVSNKQLKCYPVAGIIQEDQVS